MGKKQSITKEEAIILLQSQPMNAHLWQLADVDLKKNALRFPDPSYLDSQSWPEYMQERTKNELKAPDLYRDRKIEIESTTNLVSGELNENEVIETEIYSNNQENKFTENILVQEAVEIIPIEIDSRQSEEQLPELSEEVMEEIPIKKTKIPTKRKSKKKKEEIIEFKNTEDENAIDQDNLVIKMNTETTSLESLDFYEWLEELKEAKNTSIDEAKKGIKQKSAKPKAKLTKSAQEIVDAKTIAENSLKLGDEIVSETLARLLARQGHREEAIEMYQKLILKYPEKGATFAAALQKLKS